MSRQIIQFLFDMFLPLLSGYFLRQLPRDFTTVFDKLVRLNISAIFPLLCALSLWAINFDPRFIWLPVLGVLQQIFPGLVGYLLGRGRFDTLAEEGSFVISSLLSNRAMLGTLSVFILLGEQAYAMAQLVVFLEPMVTFAGAFSWASYYRQRIENREQEKFRLKSLINRNMLPLVGMLAGLSLHFSGWERPAFLSAFFPYLVHINAWSLLLTVGYSINLSGIKGRLKPIWALAAIKFAAAPLLTLLILIPFWQELDIVKVLMTLSFVPTAVFAILAAKIYRLDEELTVAVFVVTTLMYLVVVFPMLEVALHLVV